MKSNWLYVYLKHQLLVKQLNGMVNGTVNGIVNGKNPGRFWDGKHQFNVNVKVKVKASQCIVKAFVWNVVVHFDWIEGRKIWVPV